MLLIYGTNPDLHPCMRLAVDTVDRVVMKHTGVEAVMTSARDREHSPGSFHYYGLAFDIRIRNWTEQQKALIVEDLMAQLPSFDIVLERTHLHVEVGRKLGSKLGAYIK